MKRTFDLLLSSIGLLVASPLLLILALAVWLDDGAPVLFRQRRVGRDGVPFWMLKFRSMRVGGSGPSITVGADSRITRIGRFLRRLKLDELPQLCNVLRGEMSFVGPRPEVEEYVKRYSDAERVVLHLKPGITDPASLAMFDEGEILAQAADPESYYVKVLMPEKIRVNLEYASRADFGTDLLVILATVLRAFGLRFDVFARLNMKSISLEGPGR